MNRKQKIVIIAAMVIILAMAIYPPFKGKIEVMRFSEYGYFYTQPQVIQDDYLTGYGICLSVDISRLQAQWLLIIILTTGLVILFKDDKKT